MLSERQQKILQLLVKEYIDEAEPISSDLLKRRLQLDISPATIRNELQDLTEKGYLAQPHTSAGRIPTEKGYEFFIEITLPSHNHSLPNYITQEIQEARQKIHAELQLARSLVKELEKIAEALDIALAKQQEKEELLEILQILTLWKKK